MSAEPEAADDMPEPGEEQTIQSTPDGLQPRRFRDVAAAPPADWSMTLHSTSRSSSEDSVLSESRLSGTTWLPISPAPNNVPLVTSWGDFFFQYYSKLSNQLQPYCFGDEIMAEDILSETFLKVLKMAKPPATYDNPYGWFLMVARRVAIDLSRKEDRRTTRERDRELALPPIADEVERLLLEIEVKALPEPAWRVIWYRYILGYDRKTVAKIMDRSLRWVDEQNRKGLGHLRRNRSQAEER
ncbi:sigma-70 family RNA polymerase sigma factor [Streptomyces sp. NBC_00386]|uniref:RNA polymerase sigma factor n=1 Tax=Streptomyces sp. NBC_00386 TaxID=2975734 RepID=UPI002E1FE0AE